MRKRILVIGDTHFPFVSSRISRLYDVAKELQPNHIVQVGDLYDMFSFSKYPRTHTIMTPRQELEKGQKMARSMWDKLKTIAPDAKCHQLLGNHDGRVMKRIIESVPEAETLIDIGSLFRFQGVTTTASEREELIIGDILFMHGFRSKLGDHVSHNKMSTVCGHSHVGGVVFVRLGDEILFELNAGFLAAEESKALGYTAQRRISKWTLGCGFIDEFGPRFIPFGD